VALDRQSIEKKDFPVGKRGYDPEAVDAHLSALADEIAEYRRSARRRSDALATSASDQVRAIVEAAENSAADIQRDAENDARDIRQEAEGDAQATRDQAGEQAREYVGRVSESTNSTLQRLDEMRQELEALIGSIRGGSDKLGSNLHALEGNFNDVSDAVSPRTSRFQPDATPEPAAEPQPEHSAPEPEAAALEHVAGGSAHGESEGEHAHGEGDDAVGEAEPAVGEAEHAASESTTSGAPVEPADDAEGARLIALNMALNGTPRDQTQRYLSENFHLSDAGGLLDEVYASVEG
jgi:DivIVA domain-containing protein